VFMHTKTRFPICITLQFVPGHQLTFSYLHYTSIRSRTPDRTPGYRTRP
jgi:hypothetical protein